MGSSVYKKLTHGQQKEHIQKKITRRDWEE